MLAVLKLWNSGGPGLDFDRFKTRIEGGGDYDAGDLRALLRKDQNPDLKTMIRRVVEGFRFLDELTELEKSLAADPAQRRQEEAAKLLKTVLVLPEGG